MDKLNSQNQKLKRKPKLRTVNTVFETTDIFNVPVSLPLATWEEHIKVYHPEIEEYLTEAKGVIEDPNVVSIDTETQMTKIFSGLGLGRGRFKKLYLRTIVQYGGVRGRVATIHFADTLPRGKIIWIRKNTKI